MCPNGPSGRTCDAAQQFEERRFAGTVLADDADDVALLDLEVDVAEGPDVVGVAFGGTVVGFADLEVWVLFAKNIRYPKSAYIVRQCLRGH